MLNHVNIIWCNVLCCLTLGSIAKGMKRSKAFCEDTKYGQRCSFLNVCYDAGKLILFRNPEETSLNLPQIDISGVRYHTGTQLLYTLVDWDEFMARVSERNEEDLIFRPGKHFLFHRFLPNNLMHVLHDDLLPYFSTIQQLQIDQIPDTAVTTAFRDPYPIVSESFQELYEAVMGQQVFHLDEENLKAMKPICFEELLTGLSNKSLWYQYGFFRPQSSLIDNYSSIEMENLRNDIVSFASKIKERLKIEPTRSCNQDNPSDKYSTPQQGRCPGDSEIRRVVVFSRKENRKILNENDMVLELSLALRAKVVTVGMETHSLFEILETVNDADILIGMHGSLLSSAMFLSQTFQNKILVELFPYAVPPENYTPYRTLCSILGIRYVSWRNTEPENTVTHPDYPKELGGIPHLASGDQKRIMESTEVPPHICCSDPEFLLRIYQDTVVDIDYVISAIRKLDEK